MLESPSRTGRGLRRRVDDVVRRYLVAIPAIKLLLVVPNIDLSHNMIYLTVKNVTHSASITRSPVTPLKMMCVDTRARWGRGEERLPLLFLRFACPLLPNAARGVPSDDVPFDSWESRWECRGEPPVPPPEPRSSIVSSGAIVYELSWSGAEALFSDTA